MTQALLSFLFIFAFLYHGHILGVRFFYKQPWYVTIFPGLILFAGLQSLLQTIWYYADASLGRTSDLVSVLGALLIVQILAIIVKRNSPQLEDVNDEAPAPNQTTAVMAVLNLFVAAAATGWIIRAAFHAGTTASIRTPWTILPDSTLAFIALIWLTLFLSAVFFRCRWISVLHAVFALCSTLAIAPLIYRIGFGFDGFLHIASEKILLLTGTLNPKPFYYIGQYVFTTWLSRLSQIPVSDIDRWLVPVFASLLLPFAIFFLVPKKSDSAFGFTALALLPLGAFVATTPQAFAYVLGLTALILGAAAKEKRVHPFASLILSAWAITVHPLAGIPLALVLLAVLTRKYGSAFFVILAGLSIPALFFMISSRSGTQIDWNFFSAAAAGPWLERLTSFVPYIGNRFVLWPAWATLVSRSIPIILLSLALSSPKKNAVWIAAAISLWISAVILKTTGDFTFLIDYERGNYADRLNLLAIFCLFPASIQSSINLWRKILISPRVISVIFILFGTAFGTALAYDSLPRHDALVIGRGWSTSAADIEAVKIIDRDSESRDYTVLANQSVSAAAVASFGFKRYADDIFYYPIPTGGPLYDLYLRMTYNEPSRDTVKDAALLAQADLVYVVINNYWWRAETVAEDIRGIADKNWDVADGQVRIYKFDFSKDSSLPTAASTR